MKLKQRKYILGIVSNFEPILENVLCRLDFPHYFDVIVSSEKVGYAKPDPHIFHLALGCITVSPKEVIYVGDNYYC